MELLVITSFNDAMSVLVETEKNFVLVKPEIEAQLRHCSVRINKLDSVLAYVPSKDLCSVLLKTERPHTRSQCTSKPVPTRRHPRVAHNNKTYHESDLISDEEPNRKRSKPTPCQDGPSEERMNSQNQITVHPAQRLPPVKTSSAEASDSPTNDDSSGNETELYTPESESESGPAPKGKFNITTKTLKKSKKYKCKHCELICDSSKSLTEHHQKKHKIMYCNICSKAFDNPTTYSRHLKSHTKTGQICSICGKCFAHASQLQTHQSVHSDQRHKCSHDGCSKSFKNLGDLTRHVKQHTGEVHQCPDCDYSNRDIRNFESHRFKHSQISQYTCEYCGKEFVYNTQYHRHIKNFECKLKGSESPKF